MALQAISYLFPTRYFMVITRTIFLKGGSFAILWPQFAALAVFAVAIVVARGGHLPREGVTRMSWRRIRLLIWKEFIAARRDRSMLPILFIMPIIQLLLFGYVVGSSVRNIDLAVLDQDHTVQSRVVVAGVRRLRATSPS